ncbi:MAG: energy transducer TonB [Henriciella sp.]|nr:energy transducer TonB [Henriciella sp.]
MTATAIFRTLPKPPWPGQKQGRGVAVRLMQCVIPAAIITTGLFLGMQALIKGNNYEPPVSSPRIIEGFTVKFEGPPTIYRDSRVILLPDAVAPPAAPPPLKAGASINFEPIQMIGAVPDIAEIDRMLPITLPTTGLGNREARPIRAPIVTYPEAAARKGIQGTCDVRMDVTPQGRPYNVVATCTSQVFVKEAERAVSRVEFLPKISNGEALRRQNVIYPLDFKLDQ